MNLYETILFELGVIGIVLILTNGYIFRSLRSKPKSEYLRTFLSCPQCIGFWAGFFSYIVFNLNLTDIMFWLYAILHGGMISLLSMLFNRFIS